MLNELNVGVDKLSLLLLVFLEQPHRTDEDACPQLFADEVLDKHLDVDVIFDSLLDEGQTLLDNEPDRLHQLLHPLHPNLIIHFLDILLLGHPLQLSLQSIV
jgi:hypothetical protein